VEYGASTMELNPWFDSSHRLRKSLDAIQECVEMTIIYSKEY